MYYSSVVITVASLFNQNTSITRTLNSKVLLRHSSNDKGSFGAKLDAWIRLKTVGGRYCLRAV